MKMRRSPRPPRWSRAALLAERRDPAPNWYTIVASRRRRRPPHRQSRRQGQAGRVRQLHLPALRRIRAQGRRPVRLGYLMPGKVSVESAT